MHRHVPDSADPIDPTGDAEALAEFCTNDGVSLDPASVDPSKRFWLCWQRRKAYEPTPPAEILFAVAVGTSVAAILPPRTLLNQFSAHGM